MRHLRLVFIISVGVLALPLHRAVAQPMSEWLASGPASDCDSKTERGFFGRLVGAYADHLRITGTESGPDLAYRGAPAPVSSPPFPFSTWPIGGTMSIGYPDTSGGPLMDAIYCGPYGQLIKDSRIKVYGWFDPGANFSTSNKSRFSFKQGVGGNNPTAYDVYPNTVQMDQAVLYIERVPDTVQTDHIDWGFRIANLWGTDYKYTFARGLFSEQYIHRFQKYGYDPTMVYLDVYFPHVAEGLNVRVGRYISIPDIEAQLAPNNYTYSHSLLYSFDPYTQTGIVGTMRLNKNWTFQLEFSGGNDIMPWDTRNRKPTPAVCVSWTSDSGNDNFYPCLNGINDGKYAYNNLNMLVSTWYHKFTDNWHMATEIWYMWEGSVPNVKGPLPTIPNANGAVCAHNKPKCFTQEYAILNYQLYQVSPHDYLVLRNEIFNDEMGQRTGYKTLYSEHTIGWNHWIGDVITLRPELRFERAYNQRVYDNGRDHSQFTMAMDIIFHY